MRISSLLPRLWANWITLLGSVITMISGFGIILMVVVGLSTSRGNPYQGLFVAVVLPVAFGIGLLLIPLGLYVDRHRRSDRPRDGLQAAFEMAFKDRSARRRVVFVAIATILNVGLFAVAGQKTLEHMESPRFCGTTCHTPMQPEWEAWNRSPHSNVACVECHIARGASGMIKAKWNGMHQLVGVMTANFERPVVADVGDVPAAKATCTHCHAPERWRPDRIKLFPHYEPDKANTPKFNGLAMRLGGYNRMTGKYVGIHWHVAPENQVKYEYLDRERAKIGKVTLLKNGEVVAEYLPPAGSQKPLGVRTMDCIDCHNRPTHVFDGTAKNAVDRALFFAALDPATPYMAQVSIELLTQAKVPRDQAEQHFQKALAEAYQTQHPDVKLDDAALGKAAKTLSMLYLRNVFPDMKVSWNRYRSNIGHQSEGPETVGCFRCHDKREATLASGKKKKLSQECDLCHTGIVFDQNPDKFDDSLAALMPAAN
ncbi:MAG: NapC/NirT family cytochrome c [Myxococcales bacterium]